MAQQPLTLLLPPRAPLCVGISYANNVKLLLERLSGASAGGGAGVATVEGSGAAAPGRPRAGVKLIDDAREAARH